MYGSYITEEKILEWQKFLLENPIDHQWDQECELFDECNAPENQQRSRIYKCILKELNRLPEGMCEIEATNNGETQ